ncbi:hypothetical protein [Isoptericola aurantiacus]|uniref:hypothetical protein n=1 Tax=Isoptericola aurantiacus TaxID=3377839 RepID=UPI00383BB958
MFLKDPRPPEPGKSPVWMYGRDYFPDAEHWVEIWMVTGDHTMMPGTAAGAEKIVHLGPDGHRGGPYPKYHHDADNLMFFTGTDPDAPRDLGAHVEFHLGEGDAMQVFHFEEPRCIVIPRGVRHFPMIVSGLRRPFVVTDVLTAPTRSAAGTETDFSFVAPDRGAERGRA